MTKETFEKAIELFKKKYRVLPSFIPENETNISYVIDVFHSCMGHNPEKSKEILLTLIKGVNEIVAERRKEFDAEIEAL